MRYGVGVGRPGFEWAGVHTVTRKAEWPDWHPPVEMRKRQPNLPLMMPGGPKNPSAHAPCISAPRSTASTEPPSRDDRPRRVVGLHPHAQRRRDRPLLAGEGRNARHCLVIAARTCDQCDRTAAPRRRNRHFHHLRGPTMSFDPVLVVRRAAAVTLLLPCDCRLHRHDPDDAEQRGRGSRRQDRSEAGDRVRPRLCRDADRQRPRRHADGRPVAAGSVPPFGSGLQDRRGARTVVIDTKEHFLYVVMPNGRAMRYGVGVGREGFAVKGCRADRFQAGVAALVPAEGDDRARARPRPHDPRHDGRRAPATRSAPARSISTTARRTRCSASSTARSSRSRSAATSRRAASAWPNLDVIDL